jgi:tetratricopeptide (TPR) repeat protein
MALLLSTVSGCGAPHFSNEELTERAAVLCDKDRGAEALQLLDKVTAQPTQDARPHYLKGLAYELTGQYDLAKQAYDQCLQRAPDDSSALNNRGVVWVRLGQYDQAQADLQKATQLNPTDHLAWSNLGLVHHLIGQHESAITCYRTAYALNAEPRYMFQLGNTLVEAGNLDAAIQAYSQSIATSPDFAAAYLCRAIASEKQGLIDQALADLSEAAKHDLQFTLRLPIHELRTRINSRQSTQER